LWKEQEQQTLLVFRVLEELSGHRQMADAPVRISHFFRSLSPKVLSLAKLESACVVVI